MQRTDFAAAIIKYEANEKRQAEGHVLCSSCNRSGRPTEIIKQAVFRSTGPESGFFEKAIVGNKVSENICADCVKFIVKNKNAHTQAWWDKRKEAYQDGFKTMARLGVGRRYLGASLSDFPRSNVTNFFNSRAALGNFGFVFIYGPVGTGKTHLAAALVKKFMLHFRSYPLISSSEMLLDIRSNFNTGGSEKRAIESYCCDSSISGRIIDDLGTDKATDWNTQTLMLMIDRRYSDNLNTVFISNLTISDIAKLHGDRVASRLQSGKVFKFDGKDIRMEHREQKCLVDYAQMTKMRGGEAVFFG
jgi:chromosomal replication initiation ATPase DnaA